MRPSVRLPLLLFLLASLGTAEPITNATAAPDNAA
jgi:hypothetical protein